MKKTVSVFLCLLMLALAAAGLASAEILRIDQTKETKTIFDVTNMTSLSEGMAIEGGSLHRLRGASNTLETVNGEQLIKMVSASDSDVTANRIELSFTGLNVVGYRYLRIRLINPSDSEVIRLMIGFEGTAWLGRHYVVVNADDTVKEDFPETFFPVIMDGFDGYVYVDLQELLRQGDEATTHRDYTDGATLDSTSHPGSYFNPTAVTAFNIRLTHEVGEPLYFGDFVLCNTTDQAAAPAEPTPTPVPQDPTDAPTSTPVPADPTAAPQNPSNGAVSLIGLAVLAAVSGTVLVVRKKH
ncbi:MAG: hypothetical protein KIG36_01265 [Eubacteriales bacterium]|nr:hypothetical protein [Eubacteriales bacterium]